MNGEKRILDLLHAAVADGVFPGAVLLVSRAGHRLFFQAAGNAALLPAPRPMSAHTIFDLASLTKPLATTLAVLIAVTRGKLGLDSPLVELLAPRSIPRDKSAVTLRQLLAHSAGFPAWKPYYLELAKLPQADRKRRLFQLLLEEPLEYAPGERSRYSDLGFFVIQWIVEETTARDLHHFTRENLYEPLHCTTLSFRPLEEPTTQEPRDFAATEQCPWRGRVLSGEVHDENAYVMGGVAGQAGLFGTAADVGRLLAALLRSRAGLGAGLPWAPERLEEFLRRAYPEPARTWAVSRRRRSAIWGSPAPLSGWISGASSR
jgi:CubicO group peptidase (beta-lactamase class C family)